MATEILRPNGAGDETNIVSQFPDSTSHWDKVDDVISDDDTTYIYQNKDSNIFRDLYTIESSEIGVGIINSITVYFRCKNTLGNYPTSFLAGASLKSDTTVSDKDLIGLTSTEYTNLFETWTINPDTSSAWNWADIASLQIGVRLKGNAYPTFTACSQVYVEIDYTEASSTLTGVSTIQGINTITL